MRWSDGRGARDRWEGQRGEELEPKCGQQLAPESREWTRENTNDAPPPPQVLHSFGVRVRSRGKQEGGCE